MEQKERYEIYKDNRENSYICDTSKNIDYKTYQEFIDLLNQQNQHIKELEQEIAKLQQKAIVPKFQIGQKVFIILDGIVKETTIDSITIFVGNELSYYCKYVDNKRIYLELAENEVFTTREEAKQKLAKIKGEKK